MQAMRSFFKQYKGLFICGLMFLLTACGGANENAEVAPTVPPDVAIDSKINIALNDELILPKVSGPFKVGETTVYMQDKSRSAFPALPGSPVSTDSREWVVNILYPAMPDENATPSPYAEKALSAAYSKLFLPAASVGTFDRIHRNAYWNAPANRSNGKFPILLFSPGGGNQALFYSSLLEEISSYGYIVITVPEPFDTPVIPLPDGRVLTRDQLLKWSVGKNEDEMMNAMKEDRAKDMLFTLNELEKLNRENSIFDGIFDFAQIGAFGHSLGGAASVRVAQLDARVKSVAVLDGYIFHVIPEDSKPVSLPVLYMASTNIDLDTKDRAEIAKMDGLTDAYFSKGSRYYFAEIAGTVHQSFQTDAMFLAPYTKYDGQSVTMHASNTTPERITSVITNYVLAFFDQHLKGIDQSLLTGASASYPEVTFRVKK